MEQATKEAVEKTLEDLLQRMKQGSPVGLFAVVAAPENQGGFRTRFLLYQQGNPGAGAAVALAVGQNAEKIFGEFDKWMRKAGFAPGRK